MSLIPARLAAGLDEGLDNVTHVFWSANGSSVTAHVDPTAVTLKSATTANPSVKSNDGSLESAAAAEAVTVTHYAFGYLDDTTPVLQTTWVELDDAAVLLQGGKLTVADGALSERLHQTDGPPA